MLMPRLTEQENKDRSHPVQEDMRLQRRHWAFERIAGAVVFSIVVLALLGVFSTGILSTSVAGSGALKIEYQRFQRNGAASLMVIDAMTEPGKTVRLDITGELLDNMTIESIHPAPVTSSTVDHKGLSIVVAADEAGHVRAYLSLRTDGVGLIRSQVQSRGERVDFWQFIYP